MKKEKTGIQQLQQLKKSKLKLNTLDKYIIFCFIVLVIYSIVHTIIFAITGNEAKTLTTVFFGLFGFEILCCFLSKRFKLHDDFKLVRRKDEQEIDDKEIFLLGAGGFTADIGSIYVPCADLLCPVGIKKEDFFTLLAQTSGYAPLLEAVPQQLEKDSNKISIEHLPLKPV